MTELLDMRRLLEPAAAATAARSLTAERRKRLQEAFARLEAATGEPEAFAEREGEFFSTIRDTAGNRILRALGRIIGNVLPAPGTKPSVTAHRKVLDALLAGKAEEAQRAMQKLVSANEGEIAKALLRQQRARKRG